MWIACATCAGAASLNAAMNYESNTAELVYTSDLAYPAYITAVMTKGDITEPTADDYLQVGEALCGAGESTVIEMKISPDIEDDEYKFFAVAGGKDAIGSEAQDSLEIIGKTTIDNIIKEVNGCGEKGISEKIYSTLGAVLKLDAGVSAKKDGYIYETRKADYSNAFVNLNDIRNAWVMSDVLIALEGAQVTEFAELLAQNNELFGLSLDNEDFVRFGDETCRILKAMLSKGDIKSKSAMLKKFNEAVAVAAINKSDVKERGKYFEKYAEVLGISQLMNAYKKLDSLKFARQFENAAFNDAAAVYSKFDSTIKSMSNSGGNGGGSGGGGNSGGNSSFNLSGAPGTVPQDKTPQNTESFTDIDSSHWAYESVLKLKGMNIINGYSDGSFAPDKEVAREEFVTMIVLAFGYEKTENAPEFSDVSDTDWFYKYVMAAAANNIISGIGDGSFGAGNSITRQEAAVILDRILTSLGTERNAAEDTADFADADTIGEWAAQSAKRLAAEGIISGIDGNFAPASPVTRAQAAKLIYGCMQYVSRA